MGLLKSTMLPLQQVLEGESALPFIFYTLYLQTFVNCKISILAE
jgi:hypothetical protein